MRGQNQGGRQGIAGNKPPVVPIILDSDMASDPGDAGALFLLHTLADQGLALILATTCMETVSFAPGCADAINRYHNRGSIPVGVNKGAVLAPGPDPNIYNQYIAENFPNRYPTANNALVPDAVEILRQTLALAPPVSVTICTIGQCANISHLLNSVADSISPLNGSQLISAKVKKLVIMGGDYPTGHEYNFYTDWTTAADVCANWPTRIEFVGFSEGLNVKTGQTIINSGDLTNPLYWAYHLFKVQNPTLVPRESWDQLAVLLAVYGLESLGTTYFTQIGGGSNTVLNTGDNQWGLPVKDQVYTLLNYGPSEFSTLIDSLEDA